MAKSNLGRSLFQLIDYSPSWRGAREGISNRNLRTLLTYWLAPRLTVRHFSYSAQAHEPRDGTAHSGMRSLTSINNQENAIQTCSQVSLNEDNSSVGVLSSQVYLGQPSQLPNVG